MTIINLFNSLMKKFSHKAQIESCYVVNINECSTKIMDLRDLREVAIPIKIGKSDYFNFSGRGIEMTWKKARTSFIYFSHMHIFFAYAMVFGCTIHTFAYATAAIRVENMRPEKEVSY